MKHLDDKYLVPFPEFFAAYDYDIEVYLGIDEEFKNFPVSFNIVFVRSANLEEIKEAARQDWKIVQGLNLPADVKLAVQKLDDKLSNCAPADPYFKLQFEHGREGYRFDPEARLITVFIENDALPDPSKVIFFPSDLFTQLIEIKP